jgi:hypothetical protein
MQIRRKQAGDWKDILFVWNEINGTNEQEENGRWKMRRSKRRRLCKEKRREKRGCYFSLIYRDESVSVYHRSVRCKTDRAIEIDNSFYRGPLAVPYVEKPYLLNALKGSDLGDVKEVQVMKGAEVGKTGKNQITYLREKMESMEKKYPTPYLNYIRTKIQL